MPVAIANRPQIDDDEHSVLSENYKDEAPIDPRYGEDRTGNADLEDDFDDFEEGAEYDDFGDFDGEFDKSIPKSSTQPIANANENVNNTSPNVHIVSYNNLGLSYLCKMYCNRRQIVVVVLIYIHFVISLT